MCGIVGAIAERNITPVLVEGLKRLEYRGYDSAGVALLTEQGALDRRRRVGKVSELQAAPVSYTHLDVYKRQTLTSKNSGANYGTRLHRRCHHDRSGCPGYRYRLRPAGRQAAGIHRSPA